ncbi:MAG: DUF559 domain-containing protein [Leptospiraceae bacterium]|nr:DUF559 domain-containing protein [Leptospiraceae bacterium]
MLPFNKNSKEKARKLRNNMTLAEKKIWYDLLAKDELTGLAVWTVGCNPLSIR